MRKEKGLTLIALIVTIIVMIILAGIAISAITGKSGITNQARESKNKSERQEIIESAKSQISDTVVENVGTDITRSQLKEILDKYFENVPDDYTLDTELTTKSEYGDYVIKVSEIYDRTTIFADNGEDSSETTPANTSSTNGGSSDNSGSNNSSTNNSNNSGTNSSTQNTSSTNSNWKNSASTENSESTGTDNSNVNEDPTNNTSREPEEIDVTGVKLDNKSVILDLNGKNTIQLNATPIPNNANKNTKMKWTSKKKTVATVTQDGMVTGKAVGNSTIMAASKNGKSAECLVVCQAKITGITVNPVTASIPVGGTIQLTATIAPNTVTEKITWKSSNTYVAKVDRNGLVTGVGNGRITITAQNPAGTIKATCTVTVGNATLMVASSGTDKDTDNYLRSNVAKNKIESIKFVKGQVQTSGIIEQFDASKAEDSSIIGYYTDEDSNGMYELTISSEVKIEANSNSSRLFSALSKVKEIKFENFDTSQVTDMSSMFVYCRSLISLDVSKFDTSQVTNMSSMFFGCSSLISLDVSKFDTSQVTNMGWMFFECSGLTSLDVSKFDTSQVTDMKYMFYKCSSLTSLDVSKFDTSQVTDMSAMFLECSGLTSLDVSKFNTSKVINMSIMFYTCNSLSKIYVSEYNETTDKGWTTKNVTDSRDMFYAATKLVGGNGTVYNLSNRDATYARIDKEGEPGYFTEINNHITIPELAVLSQFEGEYENIDRGIVIYIMKDANGDGKIDTPDWTNKTKMQETYDQFVWVPVKNAILDLSSTYSGLNDAGIRSKVQEQINVGKYPMAIKTNTAGDYIGVLYEFSEVTENNTTYVKVTPESLWNPKSTILREPAGLKDSTYGDTVTYLKQINGILNTSYNTPTSFESALQSQYNEMVKKVEEKGGFWVGRYETSSMSNSTTENYIASNRIQVSSKRNTTNGLVGVTWYKMYAQQKIYSELALESKTTSSMIWGSQYDQIMIWMKEEKSSDQAPSRGKYYVTNGAGKGNYGTISGVKNDVYSGYSGIAPTGSQDPYSTKNIFDLAGNVYEWSLEACNTYYRTRRGGYFLDTNAYATRPDDRNSYCPTDSISYDGSRLTLY